MSSNTITSLDRLDTGLPQLPERATRSPQQIQQGALMLETLRRDPPGLSVGNRLLQSQKLQGPIYLAVNAIMTAMGGIRPQIQRRVKHTNKTTFLPGQTIRKSLHEDSFGLDHEYVPAESDFPACQLLEHPNERGDTFKDVLKYQIMQDRLTGISYLWCVPNHKGQPVELYAMPTALTIPNLTASQQYPNGAYQIMPYYANGALAYGMSGAGATIPAEEMRRRKRPHPYLMWDGYSPLTAGAIELDILSAIDQCWWTMMDEGVILDTMIMLPGQDANQIARFEGQVKQRHGGARNARRIFTLGGGDANAKYDVKQLSPGVKDMDFPDGRATMLEFCLALFGVPMDIVLSTDAGSFSKLYANMQKFRMLTLQPDANDWADFYSRVLCDPWSKKPGQYRMKLELPALNDPDLDQAQQKIDINIVSVNDRRAKQNLPPVKYGEYPEPIYLAKLQAEAAPQPTPAPLPAAGPDKRDDNRADGAVGGPSEDRPENPAGEGSLGPRPMLKAAMSAINATTGGAMVGTKRRKSIKGKKAERMLQNVCKSILAE